MSWDLDYVFGVTKPFPWKKKNHYFVLIYTISNAFLAWRQPIESIILDWRLNSSQVHWQLSKTLLVCRYVQGQSFPSQECSWQERQEASEGQSKGRYAKVLQIAKWGGQSCIAFASNICILAIFKLINSFLTFHQDAILPWTCQRNLADSVYIWSKISSQE